MHDQSPKRGAIPSPPGALAAAVSHVATVAAPPEYLVAPGRLSTWGNLVHGDCVTAEEAFAKATSNSEIFISDDEVIRWATDHGVLEGADLSAVLTWMQTDGFAEDPFTYGDGAHYTVDWKNAATLQSAISTGPVKLGVAGDQIEEAWLTTGGNSGWFATGFHRDTPVDHCVALCGYGSLSWLAQQLGVQVPVGIDGTQPGYAVFTWGSIGIIDEPSVIAVTGEAWLRQPTTVTNLPVGIKVAFQANDSSHELYVTSSNDGVNFTTPATGYDAIALGSAPAMAIFNDNAYVGFQANDSSHELYVTSGANYTMPATGYSGIRLGSAPAMAVFNGKLYIAFQADDSSNELYVTSSDDGVNFTTPATGYEGIQIGSAPAMAVFNGKLYIAFQADDSSNELYVTSSDDGVNFTTPATGYEGIQIGSAPAMAVFNGKLYIAFQADDSSNELYVTSSDDGVNFTTPATGYEGIQIGSAPAMAVFNGKLYVAFRANDSSHELYVTSSDDGVNFARPATGYEGIQIGSAPAMAVVTKS